MCSFAGKFFLVSACKWMNRIGLPGRKKAEPSKSHSNLGGRKRADYWEISKTLLSLSYLAQDRRWSRPIPSMRCFIFEGDLHGMEKKFAADGGWRWGGEN